VRSESRPAPHPGSCVYAILRRSRFARSINKQTNKQKKNFFGALGPSAAYVVYQSSLACSPDGRSLPWMLESMWPGAFKTKQRPGGEVDTTRVKGKSQTNPVANDNKNTGSEKGHGRYDRKGSISTRSSRNKAHLFFFLSKTFHLILLHFMASPKPSFRTPRKTESNVPHTD
jgi:hypothetical protein